MKRIKRNWRDSLIRAMLKTFADLGNDPTARIDARCWHSYYLRIAQKRGVNVKEPK